MSADLHELAREEPDALQSIIDKAEGPLKDWLKEIQSDVEGDL